MFAKPNNNGDPWTFALKIMHKDSLYQSEGARGVVLTEKRACERITACSKAKYLLKTLATWDDEKNIYFLMVSTLISCVFIVRANKMAALLM